MEVGRRMREARKAAGLTQRKAAKALGHDEFWLSRRENGKAPISVEDLAKMIGLYEIEDSEIIDLVKATDSDAA